MRSVGTKLTPKMVGDISTAYKAGKTTTEIALEYGLSKATVCRGLRKVGINPERKDNLFTQKELTQEQKLAICNDYNNGISLKDLGNSPFCVNFVKNPQQSLKRNLNKYSSSPIIYPGSYICKLSIIFFNYFQNKYYVQHHYYLHTLNHILCK